MRRAWLTTASGGLVVWLCGSGAAAVLPSASTDDAGSHLDVAPALQLASSSLDLVEELMADSRYLEARGVLLDWWEDRAASAERGELQRAIWLRAVLTVDPTLAEQDFRRLAIEFPGGPWSDEALMRLARIAELRGDIGTARAHLEVLVRDYPGSPLRPEARLLRERLAEGPGPGL